MANYPWWGRSGRCRAEARQGSWRLYRGKGLPIAIGTLVGLLALGGLACLPDSAGPAAESPAPAASQVGQLPADPDTPAESSRPQATEPERSDNVSDYFEPSHPRVRDAAVFAVQETPAEIEADIREKITILGEGGGYMIAPAHIIQMDTSPERVEAFIQAVGIYPAGTLVASAISNSRLPSIRSSAFMRPCAFEMSVDLKELLQTISASRSGAASMKIAFAASGICPLASALTSSMTPRAAKIRFRPDTGFNLSNLNASASALNDQPPSATGAASAVATISTRNGNINMMPSDSA